MIDFRPDANCPGQTVLSTRVWLPCDIEEAFNFFADAANLESITPPWLRFRILTPLPITMVDGALIDYSLRLRHIPIRWRTEIAEWNPPHRFIDRQLRGPYRLWEHTHSFERLDGGTVVRDDVRYRVPGGRLVERWLVRPDLRRIFQYRHEQLIKQLSSPTAAPKL